MDIRDSVLLPDNYSVIDNRIPIKFVPNDEAERLFKAINPDGYKNFNLVLMPIHNYPDYVQIPSDIKTELSHRI